MSRIKGNGTKPELLVRKFLFTNGLRYRLNVTRLPGKPDIVLSRFKIAIFVHGCFWHGHNNCKYSALPKTRTDFWLQKIEGNKRRDKICIVKLKQMGWTVLTIFTCRLKRDKQEKTLSHILNIIQNQASG